MISCRLNRLVVIPSNHRKRLLGHSTSIGAETDSQNLTVLDEALEFAVAVDQSTNSQCWVWITETKSRPFCLDKQKRNLTIRGMSSTFELSKFQESCRNEYAISQCSNSHSITTAFNMQVKAQRNTMSFIDVFNCSSFANIFPSKPCEKLHMLKTI